MSQRYTVPAVAEPYVEAEDEPLATAEDIVQDSFIVAIQKENTLKDKNALNSWLSRIVINMAIHHLKEVKKIKEVKNKIFH